ncbi:MAG: hypothetical protein ACLVK8_01265 [Ruminococcus sp.]
MWYNKNNGNSKRKDENHAEIHYRLTMCRSKGYIQSNTENRLEIVREHSDAVFVRWRQNCRTSGTVFFNYAYAPSYRSMRQLGLDAGQADDLMWKMNEKMLLCAETFPAYGRKAI